MFATELPNMSVEKIAVLRDHFNASGSGPGGGGDGVANSFALGDFRESCRDYVSPCESIRYSARKLFVFYGVSAFFTVS